MAFLFSWLFLSITNLNITFAALPEKILVTGASGQLGSELTLELRKIYGAANVIASDIAMPPQGELTESGPFEILDVLNRHNLAEKAYRHNITQIYHLTAVLSATGESRPKFTWKVNMKGLENILDLATEKGIAKIYWPSSIAVFGPNTPASKHRSTPSWTPTPYMASASKPASAFVNIMPTAIKWTCAACVTRV